LLGYFFCMIAVLTAVVGVMIGLSNTSTSERVRHYPRAVVGRNVTATPNAGFAATHGTSVVSFGRKRVNEAVERQSDEG
jgi:hypothetical protein